MKNIKQVIMCRPAYFNVTYEINPWMKDQINQVDQFEAFKQWSTLYNDLVLHTDVHLVSPANGLPDMVFTANAGFIQGKWAVLSKFAKPERQPEELLFHDFFEREGYFIFQPSVPYEGQGDHLVDSQDRHWVGTGFRTSTAAPAELQTILGIDINILKLVDPRWYHLDTAFAPLPGGELLWYPEAFDKTSQKLIRKSFFKTIEVSEDDALNFACNAFTLNRRVYLPKNVAVSDALRKLHYDPVEINMSEFMKAGGACKCLTLDYYLS